jgi:pentatricopeptide repeat protein
MASGKKDPSQLNKSDSRTAGAGRKFQLQELPMAATEDEEDYPEENLVYIAYGERGEDVGFELSDNIEEAVDIYESMKEDGFKVKLFQAQELEIVDN